MYFNDECWPVPVVVMEELVDNKVGFLECLKVVLPNTVFFDGLVECLDIRVLVRSILSSNFMPYFVHLQGTDKPMRRGTAGHHHSLLSDQVEEE